MPTTDYADRGEIHLPLCTPCLARSLSVDGGSYVSAKFWADREAPCTCEDLPIGAWVLCIDDNVDRTLPGYRTHDLATAACPTTHTVGLIARDTKVCEYDDCCCGGTEHDGVEG